jgi:sirohydrochlorin cobaltochelatase
MTNTNTMSPFEVRGSILFAHGSRDPLWRKPIESVAIRMQEIAPEVLVRCAYLELTVPDLASMAAELVSLGVTSITVVPFFLGVGKHAREDLPLLMDDLKTRHPSVVFVLRPAIGEEAQMIELMARISLT